MLYPKSPEEASSALLRHHLKFILASPHRPVTIRGNGGTEIVSTSVLLLNGRNICGFILGSLGHSLVAATERDFQDGCGQKKNGTHAQVVVAEIEFGFNDGGTATVSLFFRCFIFHGCALLYTSTFNSSESIPTFLLP